MSRPGNRPGPGLAALLIALAGAVAVPPAQAGSFEVALGGEAVWLDLEFPAFGKRFAFGPSWLHHEDDGDVVGLGMVRVGERADGSGIRGGLGARLFYLDVADEDGTALGLGGFVHYPFPGDHGLGVRGRAWFAPEIASFGGAEGYWELAAAFTYEVFKEAEITVGYQAAEASFEDGPDGDLDSGLLVGFHLRF